MSTTSIEWTKNADGTQGRVWNPVTGCSDVSEGCEHCYARGMTNRLANIASTKQKYDGLTRKAVSGAAKWTGQINLSGEHFSADDLLAPLKVKKPTTWFVNSMSDLFHIGVPFEFIDQMYAVMALCPQHTFQILTKRPERRREYMESRRTTGNGFMQMDVLNWMIPIWEHCGKGPMPPFSWPSKNVWEGTSVELDKYKHRIVDLRATPAHTRFLSLEPLLGPLGRLDLDGIHWVIVGGESGPKARPMEDDWVRAIRDQCAEAGVAFFYKQKLAGKEKISLPMLDGRTWDEMPGRP